MTKTSDTLIIIILIMVAFISSAKADSPYEQLREAQKNQIENEREFHKHAMNRSVSTEKSFTKWNVKNVNTGKK